MWKIIGSDLPPLEVAAIAQLPKPSKLFASASPQLRLNPSRLPVKNRAVAAEISRGWNPTEVALIL